MSKISDADETWLIIYEPDPEPTSFTGYIYLGEWHTYTSLDNGKLIVDVTAINPWGGGECSNLYPLIRSSENDIIESNNLYVKDKVNDDGTFTLRAFDSGDDYRNLVFKDNVLR